jgi:hypothetical protein
MRFYHPELLYGLFAIAIPIIIHLFNFKRFKKVYFTNVRFLRNVQQQSKRHSQWRHLLVLATRILAIAFFVLAFARPYIPLSNQEKKDIAAANNVSVFLDNSFSMQAESVEGNLLEEARKKAREIVLAYNPSDNFRLLLNNQIPESNRFLNRDEFLDLLDEVHIEPASTSFSKIINRVANFDFNQKQHTQELYLISDFQQSQTDIDQWPDDTNLQLNLLPLVSAAQSNVFIDSCWFETPVLQKSTPLKLHYRIKNLSDQDVEKLPVSLILNDKQKALGTIDLKAYEERIEELVFRMDTAGIYDARIEIHDFPITYDDIFFFGFSISNQINVLSIKGKDGSDAIRRFYTDDSLFQFVEQMENRVDYSSLSNYNLIILNGLGDFSSGLLMELDKYTKQSGVIVIIPNKEMLRSQAIKLSEAFSIDALQKQDTSKSRISWMDVESEEFDNVFDMEGKRFRLPDNIDLPYFHKHWISRNSSHSQSVDLVKFGDGTAFLRKYQRGQTKIYLFTASFDNENSNITSHALIVPILYNLAMQGQRQAILSFDLGKTNLIAINNPAIEKNGIYKVSSVNSDFEFIPTNVFGKGNYISVDANSINVAGNYHIKLDDKSIQSIAFNYARNESDLRPMTLNDLEEKIKQNNLKNINILSSGNASLTAVVKDLHKGVQLWKLFLSLAILLLIIELFLLRFMK